jgi:putative DNA primase/helicase
VLASTQEYFEEEDSVGAWIEARCDIEPGAFVSTLHLFESWVAYAKSVGAYAGNMKAFGQMLVARGFPRAKGAGGAVRGFRGLSIRPLSVEDFQ